MQLNSLAEILPGSAQSEHQPGPDFATSRKRPTSAATRAAAAGISASAVNRPTLKRSELEASASLKPRARSTCDASGLSAAQAEPADTARSLRANRRLSPSA